MRRPGASDCTALSGWRWIGPKGIGVGYGLRATGDRAASGRTFTSFIMQQRFCSDSFLLLSVACSLAPVAACRLMQAVALVQPPVNVCMVLRLA